jgi:hypothetical protein
LAERALPTLRVVGAGSARAVHTRQAVRTWRRRAAWDAETHVADETVGALVVVEALPLDALAVVAGIARAALRVRGAGHTRKVRADLTSRALGEGHALRQRAPTAHAYRAAIALRVSGAVATSTVDTGRSRGAVGGRAALGVRAHPERADASPGAVGVAITAPLAETAGSEGQDRNYQDWDCQARGGEAR